MAVCLSVMKAIPTQIRPRSPMILSHEVGMFRCRYTEAWRGKSTNDTNVSSSTNSTGDPFVICPYCCFGFLYEDPSALCIHPEQAFNLFLPPRVRLALAHRGTANYLG